jgi:hypothetical protein
VIVTANGDRTHASKETTVNSQLHSYLVQVVAPERQRVALERAAAAGRRSPDAAHDRQRRRVLDSLVAVPPRGGSTHRRWA